MTNSIYNSEILPTNYILFRKDRPSQGGGILIAVNNKFPCHVIASPEDLEVICIKLDLNNPITICVIYIPPNSLTAYYDKLFDFLLNLHGASDELIIIGDFTFPDIDWDTLTGHSPASNRFCDLVFQTNLTQLITVPTHNQGQHSGPNSYQFR